MISYSVKDILNFFMILGIICLIGFILFWMKNRKMKGIDFYNYFKLCYTLIGCIIFIKVGYDIGKNAWISGKTIGIIVAAVFIIFALIVARKVLKRFISVYITKKEN